MKKIIFFLSLCVFLPLRPSAVVFAGPIESWQALETGVRDGKISKIDAARELEALIPGLSGYVSAAGAAAAAGEWAFPLEGYDIRAADKNDFKPSIYYGPYGKKGYDFFDGNKHGGHPAHDLFIRDRNRDCLDDRTLKPVNAVAVEDCVVLSVNEGWRTGDPGRGGNYIWLSGSRDNKFFYYAHLKDIFVKGGEFIKRGAPLGTVGRTGQAAHEKRSPTHLHLMVLEYRGGKMVPFDFYDKIKISDKR